MKKELGKKIRTKVPRFMSKEEFLRIIQYCEEMIDLEKNKAFFWDKYRLLYLTAGLLAKRSIEISTVQIQDFLDRNCSKLKIRLAKTDKVLTHYIPKYLQKEFYGYIQRHKRYIIASGGYLFYSFNPASKNQFLTPCTIKQTLDKICDSLGIGDFVVDNGVKRRRIGMHSFRRLGATEMESIAGLKAAQRLLAHKHLTTTSIYIQDIPDNEHIRNVDFLCSNMIKQDMNHDLKMEEDIIERKIKKVIQDLFSGKVNA